MDAGELGTAAVQLGVAHPTGFPLYLLGAKATTLLPAAELALRLNLFSALCAALACVLVARLGRALAPSRVALPAGLFGAALTLCGTTFWTQGNVLEVYAPSLCATLALLLLLHRVARHPDDARGLWLLAFAAGLGTGLHATLRLAAGALVVALLATPATRHLLGRHLGGAAAAFALGLGAELYLPLASARGTDADWGAPDTWAAFVDHLSAARIRRAFAAQLSDLGGPRLWHHAGLLAEQLAEVVTAAGLPLVALGALTALRRARAAALALCVLFVADALFALLVNPMGLAERQTGLLAQVAGALLVAVALGGLLAFALDRAGGPAGPRRALGRALALAVGLAALTLLGVTGTTGLDEKLRAGDHGAADLVDATLAELPTGALVLTHGDDLSAGVLYAQSVEGARPDLLRLVRQHVWDRPYVARVLGPLAAQDGALLGGEREARIVGQRALLGAVVRAARADGRAVAWEPGDDDEAAGVPLVPAGLLFQAELARHGPGPRPKLGRLLAASPAPTPGTRRYESQLWDRLGRALAATPAPEADARAEAAFREALRAAPEAAAPWNNLAVLWMRQGRPIEALRAAARATALAPLHPGHWANLGLFRLRAGDDGGARAAYARARELDPAEPRVAVGLGLVAARAGRYAEARRLFEEGLRLGAAGDTRQDALVNLQKLQGR